MLERAQQEGCRPVAAVLSPMFLHEALEAASWVSISERGLNGTGKVGLLEGALASAGGSDGGA